MRLVNVKVNKWIIFLTTKSLKNLWYKSWDDRYKTKLIEDSLGLFCLFKRVIKSYHIIFHGIDLTSTRPRVNNLIILHPSRKPKSLQTPPHSHIHTLVSMLEIRRQEAIKKWLIRGGSISHGLLPLSLHSIFLHIK